MIPKTHETLAYSELFSNRSNHIKQSAVRDIFYRILGRDVISLAGGNPDLSVLPLAEIARMSTDIIMKDGIHALQYSSGQGNESFRETALKIMAEEGISGEPDHVIVTTGSQSAQDTAAKVFCDPSDVVIVENPTYLGALNTFESYELDIRTVPLTDHGIDLPAFAALIKSLKASGKNVKMFYTVPNFNNPSGITMDLEQRRKIVGICARENILILEDNPYGLLRYEGKTLPALKTLASNNVIYCGSLSKIFAPGLRLGWALVPEATKRRFYLAAEAAILCPPAFSQDLATRYFATDTWKEQLESMKKIYAARKDAMLTSLKRFMPKHPEIHWTNPSGGFFIWLSLPLHINTWNLFEKALDAGVVFVPGTAFCPLNDVCSTARLSFSAVDEEKIITGVEILGAIILAELR